MPSPSQFHPEFGYVCPTTRFQRTLRVGAVAAVIGAAAGAVGVLMMAERADRMRSEIVATVGLTDPAAAAAVASSSASPGSSASTPSKAPVQPPASAAAAMPCPAPCAKVATPSSPAAAVPSPSPPPTDSARAAVASGDVTVDKPTRQPAAAAPAKKQRKATQRHEPPARREADARGIVVTPNGRYEVAPVPGRQYQPSPYYGDSRYQAAPYGHHYEQRPEGRGIFW